LEALVGSSTAGLIAGEVIGYVGRVGSAFDVTYNNYFLMQVVCLVISPAFFSAALYLTIGNLYVVSDFFVDPTRAVLVGRENSPLRPAWYIMIFSSFDIIALVIQAIGGSGAAQAEQQGTSTIASTHIMVFHRPLMIIPLIFQINCRDRKQVSSFKHLGTLSSLL
jgi:RTA1 like protein